MSIISISRGSYHRGSEVAQKVAEVLGYACISRDTILASSREFDTPEIRVMHNFQYAVQTLERLSFGRERFVNFISSSILRFLKNDRYVYLQDLALTAEVKAALFDFPTAGVFVDAGRVHIHVKAPENQSAAISARIERAVGGIEGLAASEIRIAPYY